MATLNHTGNSKNGKSAMFSGLRNVLRIPLAVFANGVAPASFTVDGDFAEAKVKETKEERKARLKALPKPTIAERAAKLEAKAAKLRASL